MSSGFDLDLWVAVAILAAGVGLFAWHFWSTTRAVGLVLSEGRTPRRYLILGLAAGLGILYVTRR